MASIPDSHKDLFERPILIVLATANPDGSIQNHPVWGDLHEGKVRVNTAAGRRKHKNLEDRPVATATVVDPENPFRWIEVRGKVASISAEDGIQVIDKLAKDYINADVYPGHNDQETRVTVLIEPTRVITGGE